MPEPKDIEVVEVTSENAAEVAEKEFKKEKAEREGKDPPKEEPKKEKEEPTAKTDEELLSAKDEDLSEEEITRKTALVEGKKEKPEGEAKSDQELLDAKDEDLNGDEKTRKDVLIKAAIKKDEDKKKEDDRILTTADDQLSADELTRKTEILAERGKQTIEDEKTQKEFDKEVKKYAKENKISEEVARERLTDEQGSIAKIQEKYSKDPTKLAKAILGLQRGWAKSQKDLVTVQQQLSTPKLTIESIIELIEEGKFKDNGKKLTAQEIVQAYREKNPKLTEKIEEDSVVLNMAAKEIKEHLESTYRGSLAQFEKKANAKKEKLIAGLDEADKKFLPEIKPLLDRMPPAQIMADDFDLDDLIKWAKGNIDIEEVRREAFADGFRRGQASRKIKTGPIGKGGPGEQKTGVKKPLTENQKLEALEMFPSAKDPEQAYELYAQQLVDEQAIRDKKKNKKGKE